MYITESSGDITIGNVTFAVSSSINEMECADIVVIEDNTLESVEEFSIYVSNSIAVVDSGMAEIDTEFFLLTLSFENASISIDTSDTEG